MNKERHKAYCNAKEMIGFLPFHKPEKTYFEGVCDDLLLTNDPFGNEATALKKDVTAKLLSVSESGRISEPAAASLCSEILSCAEASQQLVTNV